MNAAVPTQAPDAIERIDPPSADEFQRHYVAARRPVIIVGATADWPACALWSGDYLAARLGDRRVPVATMVDKRVASDPAVGFSHRDEPIADFIRRLRAGEHDGYAMFLLEQTLTELKGDLRTPPFAPKAPWSVWRFWMSAPDMCTPLHMDLPQNLFAQIVGRKRVTLFSPTDEWKLYRNRPWSRLPHMSPVDADAPDLTRYPRFAQARPLRCVVEPGELLYIPRFWWHQIRSTEFSISVNYWWATGWVWGIVRLALAYQRLRGLRY